MMMAQGTAVDQECRPGIDNSNAVASGSLVVMFGFAHSCPKRPVLLLVVVKTDLCIA
jgi:hypothetical protein